MDITPPEVTFQQVTAVVDVDGDVAGTGNTIEGVVDERTVPYRTEGLRQMVREGPQPGAEPGGQHDGRQVFDHVVECSPLLHARDPTQSRRDNPLLELNKLRCGHQPQIGQKALALA